MNIEAIQHVNILRHLITSSGNFPNNALLPLLVYQKAMHIEMTAAAKNVKLLFENNGWGNAWENGIHDYDHYHSTTHEVLGIISGSARVQFGGPSGVTLLLNEGDAVIIPAGVAHKALDVYDDFSCIGAYPEGHNYDMNYGHEDEFEKAMKRIKSLPLPQTDPVYGKGGPLISNWMH